MVTSTLKCYYLTKVLRQQWQSEDSLRYFQWGRLRHTMRQAYRRIAFYKELFDSLHIDPSHLTWNDFKRLPILSKERVRAEYRRRTIFDIRYLSRSIARTTSGSSGFPLTVYYDRRNYAYSEAVYARALFSQGVTLTDRIAYFWHEPFETRGFWEHLGIFRKNEILHTQREEKQLEMLQRLNPTVIHAFPSVLLVLLHIMKRSNISLNPRLIVTHGELLLDAQRKAIEDAFSATVLDQYGSNEFNRMSWQCKEHRNYHIDADSILVEFLDEEGEEVKNGEHGRLIVTHLYNDMMPLIRYDIGDYAIKIEEKCPCGRVLPLLKRLEGRKDDFLFTSNGEVVSPRRVGGAMEQVKSLNQYHFIQIEKNSFKLEVIPNESYNYTQEMFIRGLLQNIFGKDSKIEIVCSDTIERSKRGKIRAIESRYTGEIR